MLGPDRSPGCLDRLQRNHRKHRGKEQRLHRRDPAFSHRTTLVGASFKRRSYYPI
jgi:hypothetical protein